MATTFNSPFSRWLDHPDFKALLAAVLADPGDDAPRLTLSGWLDEQGEKERAEFIRVQLELEKMSIQRVWMRADGKISPEVSVSIMPRCRALLERERALFTKDFRDYKWLGPLIESILVRADRWPNLYWLRRGFLESITCTASDCLDHLDTIIKNHPIREVVLTRWSRPFSPQRLSPTGRMLYEMHPMLHELVDVGFYLNQRWPRIEFQLPVHDVLGETKVLAMHP